MNKEQVIKYGVDTINVTNLLKESKMENIFLFMKSTGNIEEGFYKNTLGFFVNESDGNRIANHYNKRLTILSDLNDAMYEYKKEMEKKFPFPESAPLFDIPKWRSGIHMDEITLEMRNERDILKEKNAEIATKDNKIYKIWQKQINGIIDDWWRENLPDGLDDLETRTLLLWDNGTLYNFKYLADIKFIVKKLEQWKYNGMKLL